MTLTLAIDPGTHQSGYAIFDGQRVHHAGIADNLDMLDTIRQAQVDIFAIEMIACYGMAVGKETFETCVWIGRFVQTCLDAHGSLPTLVYRKDVKLYLCGSPRAKDANIRQALIDMIGIPGTKKNPGPTYGVSSHAWSALAVAVMALHDVSRIVARAA